MSNVNGEISRHTLPNGIRCTLVKTPAPGTAIYLSVGEGSTKDPAERSGETHLLEHLFFSPRRGATESIPARIERMGGIYNAHVRKEYSTYWIESLPEYASAACWLLTELIKDSSWEQEVIANEYSLMEEEYSAYLTDYSLMLSDQLERQTIEGPLSRSLFSEFHGLPSRTPELFAERHKSHWQKAPLQIYVVGSLPENLIPMLSETLGSITRHPETVSRSISKWRSAPPEFVEVPIGDGGVHKESYLAWLMPLARMTAESDNIINYLFESRITRVCREAGVGYNVGSHLFPYRDLSYLYLSAVVPTEREEESQKVIESALASFTTDAISQEELERSQTVLYADMLRGLHSASDVADSIVHEIEIGSANVFPAERMQAIMVCTYAEVTAYISAITSEKRTCGVLRS